MLIHSTYHHNYLTLYKISMPELFCLTSAPIFPYEHRENLQAMQAEAYFHARQIARLLAEAAEHGIRLLSDSVLPFFAYDSCRVMLYYVARVMDPGRVDAKERLAEAIEAAEGNSSLLRLMAPLFPASETFVGPTCNHRHGPRRLTLLGRHRRALALQNEGQLKQIKQPQSSFGRLLRNTRHRHVLLRRFFRKSRFRICPPAHIHLPTNTTLRGERYLPSAHFPQYKLDACQWTFSSGELCEQQPALGCCSAAGGVESGGWQGRGYV